MLVACYANALVKTVSRPVINNNSRGPKRTKRKEKEVLAKQKEKET